MAWQEFENESTEDLIEYIKWGEKPEHKDSAEDAFIAFCFRFRDDIQTKCITIAANRGYGDIVADEIAEKTFARFFKYPKYNSGKCKSGDTDTCIKLYLYKFAGRILADYIKNEKSGGSPFTGNEEIVTDFPDIEAISIPIETKAALQKEFEIINTALSRLSPKHKTIYLTYKQYESEQRAGHYLPRTLLNRLQNELQLTQATIRKYKEEAYKKIEEYLHIYGAK